MRISICVRECDRVCGRVYTLPCSKLEHGQNQAIVGTLQQRIIQVLFQGFGQRTDVGGLQELGEERGLGRDCRPNQIQKFHPKYVVITIR